MNQNVLFKTMVIHFFINCRHIGSVLYPCAIETRIKQHKLKDKALSGLRIVFASDFLIAKDDYTHLQKLPTLLFSTRCGAHTRNAGILAVIGIISAGGIADFCQQTSERRLADHHQFRILLLIPK